MGILKKSQAVEGGEPSSKPTRRVVFKDLSEAFKYAPPLSGTKGERTVVPTKLVSVDDGNNSSPTNEVQAADSASQGVPPTITPDALELALKQAPPPTITPDALELALKQAPPQDLDPEPPVAQQPQAFVPTPTVRAPTQSLSTPSGSFDFSFLPLRNGMIVGIVVGLSLGLLLGFGGGIDQGIAQLTTDAILLITLAASFVTGWAVAAYSSHRSDMIKPLPSVTPIISVPTLQLSSSLAAADDNRPAVTPTPTPIELTRAVGVRRQPQSQPTH